MEPHLVGQADDQVGDKAAREAETQKCKTIVILIYAVEALILKCSSECEQIAGAYESRGWNGTCVLWGFESLAISYSFSQTQT